MRLRHGRLSSCDDIRKKSYFAAAGHLPGAHFMRLRHGRLSSCDDIRKKSCFAAAGHLPGAHSMRLAIDGFHGIMNT